MYVSANLLSYRWEDDVEARVASDVFEVVGVSNHERMSYLRTCCGGSRMRRTGCWRPPRAARGGPRAQSEICTGGWGGCEYWQYDPTGDYLRPVLQVLERVAGEYEELPCPGAGRRDAIAGLASPWS